MGAQKRKGSMSPRARGRSPARSASQNGHAKPEANGANGEKSLKRRVAANQSASGSGVLSAAGIAIAIGLLALALTSAASAASGNLTSVQIKMLEAVKSENYDEVISLARVAKSQAEIAQVAEELRKSDFWNGIDKVQVDSFFTTLSMIISAELGDKTFFIAAIMAMKHPRAIILAGALGALALMTVLSAMAGAVLNQLLPRVYTHYASVLLFVVFGVKLLRDAQEMKSEGPSEELEEVEAELSKADNKKNTDLESSTMADLGPSMVIQAVMWQAFTLTFLAEWGDRSQISTFAIASQKEPYGVIVGGIIGHGICTSLAVVGGRLLASRISEKTIAYAGGALFLLFALQGIWVGSSSLNNA